MASALRICTHIKDQRNNQLTQLHLYMATNLEGMSPIAVHYSEGLLSLTLNLTLLT